MILDGLSISIIGMVIVFAFLIILVAVMKGLHFGLKKLFPKSLAQHPDHADEVSAETKHNTLPVVAAAVTAVKEYMAARG